MNIHQISVFLENKAGQLAEITSILTENKIDLRAISIAETSDYGVLRMIVDDAEHASSVLLAGGFILSVTPVLALAVPDEPGGLAPILSILAKDNLDIEYMYSIFTHVKGRAYMVFRVTNEEVFLNLLAANNIPTVSNEELGIK